MVRRPLSLSLGELKEVEQQTATVTLTCAGNRRAEFNQEGEVGGVQWESGAIGNATWKGALLATVLKKAEITDRARHVWFEGWTRFPKKKGSSPSGARYQSRRR